MQENTFDIAIIGMSGEFPGAKDIKTFWKNLIDGKECIRQFTTEELRQAGVTLTEENKTNYVARGGTLNDIDLFDANFFGYAPREAAQIDPQQRKLLEHAWHALEDAALDPHSFEGNIGVFVGSSLNTYLLNNILSHPDIYKSADIQQILFGNGADYLATRIAYLLNLRGAAINIQTACSTSLVAVHEACQYLISHQVDAALAGAVSIAVPQTKGYLYSVDGMLSSDGHCRPFADDANGTVFSSGLGIIVLKRLSDAIVAGDPIYAVIKASALNNDGQQKVGYTAPSVTGQAEVIALAQNLAGISPSQISYIETHGTATTLGDAIEIAALQAVFDDVNNPPKNTCALGSLKSNLGHLDVAAGIAGLIKTTLALHHQQLPASINCDVPTTKVNWQESPFYVNTSLQSWSGEQRYAGVSSFGIGGTNAHVVLTTAPPASPHPRINKPALLIFSAKSEDELHVRLEQIAAYCEQNPSTDLHCLARTLQQGRAEFAIRCGFIVNSITDLQKCIREKEYQTIICEQELSEIVPKDIHDCHLDEMQQLLQQWLGGHSIKWEAHYSTCLPQKLHLPLYPFNRQRYWIDAYQADQLSEERLNIEDWFYLPSFRKSFFTNTITTETAPVILVLSNQFKNETLTIPQARMITVQSGEQFTALDDNNYQLNFATKSHYVELLQHLKTKNIHVTHVLHTLTLADPQIALDYESFSAQQTNGLMSLIYFIQAWENVFADNNFKLTVMTQHLNTVSNETNVTPHKAPLMAAVKVIPKEYINIAAQLIDIDGFDKPRYLHYQMQQVALELLKENYDQEEIIYRALDRWIRDYVPVSLKQKSLQRSPAQTHKVILITGGLGQLGLDIADYFAQDKTCKIALLARTKVPPESEWPQVINQLEAEHPLTLMLQRIQAMRAQGAEVQAFSADVGDKESLFAAIAQVESQLGKITGMVHAAGETVNGIISLKTAESLEESYHAKVRGTYHLYQWFQDKKLDFIVLCSSMNAIIGGLGQLDNTAANIFIDYLAEFAAQQTGQNIFAINWGAINVNRPMKVNVLHQFTELSTEHKKNRMTDAEVNDVYDRLLSNRLGARVVISTIDMQHVLKSWNHVASIEELAKDRESYKQNVNRLLQENEKPKTEIQAWVAEQWAHLLGIAAISLHDNFFNLGGHSLAAVQFITKIKEALGIKMHVMNLYEQPTLQEFSDYLSKQIQMRQAKSVNY